MTTWQDIGTEVQHMPGLDAGRPETGVMQFGDDWPGVFIRGDNAMHYAMMLRIMLAKLEGGRSLEGTVLSELAALLASSRVLPSPPSKEGE